MKIHTQIEIINFLEGLVNYRFTEDELNKKLSDFFGTKIKVSNISQERINNGEEDELGDWNLMFTTLRWDIDDDNYNPVDADIYMLPMRRDGMMYITEVGYEFI